MGIEMKVLMIGPARSVRGGISAVVNNYYRGGLDSAVELTYLGTMEDGGKWHKLWVAFKALLAFITSVGKYDLIHIHVASDISLYRKLPFIWLAAGKKKKIIIHQHGGNIEEFYLNQCSYRKQKLIKKTLAKADRLLVLSLHLKDFFGKIIGQEKIILFPSGVDVPERQDKDYHAAKLLFLGRLCREKGIEELLDACQQLKTDFPQMELYLGGVWEDKELKKWADSAGDWVHQLGWIEAEKKEQYLQECNIFVLPSYFEGQPVSLLEAMAHQCACVATGVGAIPQMLIHRKNGLLVKPKDSRALKEGIEIFLKEPSFQQNMGKEAYKKIKEEYDLQKSIEMLVKL